MCRKIGIVVNEGSGKLDIGIKLKNKLYEAGKMQD